MGHHGEPALPLPPLVIDNTRQPQMSDMTTLLNDLSYIPSNNENNKPTQGDIGETSNELTQATRNEFKELYASANEELYPSCYYATRLDFMAKFTYFKSSHTAKEMICHATGKCTKPGEMQDPVDGRAWKKFDTMYLNFAKEPRNVQLGLAADVFNSFGNLSQTYSMWPMILTTYNLPPWLCMKESSYMITLLIPGPKFMGKDIDVYLRPLIEELKILWDWKGVETIDVASGQKFNMRAMEYFPDKIVKPIIELCSLFKQICSATLMEDDMLKAQIKVVNILCDFELIYPPALFDIMIHLVIHLPLEALEGGPIRPWWMFPFERYIKKLNGYVQNKAKPKSSIAKGYVSEEALTFSSDYFRDVIAKFNRPNRNVDTPRPRRTCQFQICQCHVDNDKDLKVSTTSELFALACGPIWTLISVNSYVVDGLRYVVHSRDERRTTQNSGFCSPGPNKEMYYGQLQEIIEFKYLLFKVMLFRVKWGEAFKNNQYILVTKVKQVFYLNDKAKPHWKIDFNISFTDALILMPKFGPIIKSLLINIDKLFELARTPLNEHCSTVLLKKLPGKLGDPDKFLIPCDFPRMDECLALADLGVSINLMPLSVWNKLSLPELTPTLMTLELADWSISRLVGVAEDVFVKVGKFHFPANFVVVDFVADPRVPLILGRSFLKTGRALIDVYAGEITLRVNNEAVTFNLDQSSRYSANYNDMTVNRIIVIDMACEEYSKEVLGFSDVIASGNPTPYYDPIVSTSSPTLTPYWDSDFLLEEVDAFLALEDDPTSPKVNHSYYDTEGDILLLEAFLNDDPSLRPPTQGKYLPQVQKELKNYEAKNDKSSIDEPLKVKLKDLPPHLEYAFLEGDDKLPVIIAKDLSVEEKAALIKVLKSHKQSIAWKLSDIKGINPEFCTHKILMEDDFEPVVQHQRRVNPKIHEVIKKEVLKLLDAGLIYPISDSPWVSPVHCIPKNGGFTVVENEENELIPTRLVTGWRVCIDYRKLNEATRKDHFPLLFMDQMLERLAGNEYYCFLDGFSSYIQIPIDPKDQEKTTFTYPYGTFAYRLMPFGLCNAPGTFQRCMMAIFHDMIEKTMEVFMDDFSVFGNSFRTCLFHLEKMLKRCEDTNLCLN
uniref:Reverse transcriptase domain-containing protein n=1 Tax=Tanacetum cinerariifolium TaxID=118510 RepID=A0A699HZ30_TANCI|nr:reverse transcriptase domain-containing protein [Tanacetum cinerariifolium]